MPVETGRVALIRYRATSGTPCVGSGLLIDERRVLTAGHVADGSGHRVECDSGASDVAEVLRSDVAEVDLAVLTLCTPVAGLARLGCARVDRGRVDRVSGCTAVGFPRWRKDGGSRRSAQVDGAVPTAEGLESTADAGLRAGWLTLVGDRIPGAPDIPAGTLTDTVPSPWGGMSGAVVVAGDLVIGVVRSHNLAAGGQSLTVTPVTAIDQLPAAVGRQFWDALGVTDPARLPVLPSERTAGQRVAEQPMPGAGPPAVHGYLPYLLTSWPGGPAEAAYIAQVRDLAPDELLGREEETAELAAFCIGTEAYEWWQGPRGAGKTALAAWFAMHPPTDVRVVSFFVIERLANESDSNGFTDILLRQLALLAGDLDAWSPHPEERRRLLAPLLGAASGRLRERGERLLLVVDGLDEDQGGRPAGGPPSIASMLPAHPPDGVHVLVTSLDQFDLPDDLSRGHPLRRCPRRNLTISPHARDEEGKARWELRRQLADRRNREIVGLIAAAGGGELTVAELAELTGLEEFDLRENLVNLTRRILLTWRRRYDPDEHVYPFRTESLYLTARRLLGADLTSYGNRIHDWADNYRTAGWPETTPGYLFHPYGSLLATGNDPGRLSEVASDAARHDRMLLMAGSDAAALAEIDAAQQLMCAVQVPDLAALALLAVEHERLRDRNRGMPEQLPVVWARLGRMHHARELASSIPDPDLRASVLENISKAEDAPPIWQDSLRAFRPQVSPRFGLPVRQRFNLGVPDYVVTRRLATRLTDADSDQAAALLDTAIDAARAEAWPIEALADIAETLASANLGRAASLAEEAARMIGDPQEQALALASIAEALAATDSTRAVRLLNDAIDTITHPGRNQQRLSYYDHARVLDKITDALSAVGAEKAARLADDLAAAAESLDDPVPRARKLAVIAETLATADPDRAARLANDAARVARSLNDQSARAGALSYIAETTAAFDPAWAVHLREEATRADRIAADLFGQNPDRIFPRIVFTLAANGSWDRAAQAARAIVNPKYRKHSLTQLAEAMIATDRQQAARLAVEAEQATWLDVVRTPGRDAQIQALTAEGLAAAGLWDLAENAVSAIRPSAALFRSPAEAKITEELASAREWDRAEGRARTITLDAYRAHALANVAAGLADTEPDRAIRLTEEAVKIARDCDDKFWKARGLAGIARALAARDPVRAAELAEDAENTLAEETDEIGQTSWGSTPALIATAFAAAGSWDRAEQTCGTNLVPENRAAVLEAVVRELATDGQWDRAGHIARAIRLGWYRAMALASVAARLAVADPQKSASLADEAEQTADNITDRFERGEVLAGLALEFLSSYQPLPARQNQEFRARLYRILGKTLSSDGWFFALPPLGKLSGEAITAIYARITSEPLA